MRMFNDSWNMWYKVIYDGNVGICKIGSGCFDWECMRNEFLNEGYLVRGWGYFELVGVFGNVGMVDRGMCG